MAAVAKRLILLIFLISIVEGRVLEVYSSDDKLVSDGIDQKQELAVEASSDRCPSACAQQYGFLPCAENSAGYVFLIVVYQVLLVIGGRLIGSGSEVLFRITGTGAGNLGGIIFRILMALPSMMLVILSGIFGSKEEAQSQVSVGVGIFAGIIVFSLTIQWGSSIIYGKTDLNKKSDEPSGILDSNTSPSKGKTCMILKDSGVKTDEGTCHIAGVMLLSLIPYVVLQLVYVFDTLSGKRIITFIALIVSSLSLLSYFTYQIWKPWMQLRSLNYCDKKFMSLFDKNNDGKITKEEFIEGLKKLVSDKKSASDTDDILKKDMSQQDCVSNQIGKKFARNQSNLMDEAEFVEMMVEAFEAAKLMDTTNRITSNEKQYRKRDLLRSVCQVLLGIAILTFLGKPLITNMLQLSNAMGLPSFIFSFVVVPLVMNTRLFIAEILPASKKGEVDARLTFSEIYGGVIMNNMAGLTTLLAIVYAKELAWDFSAEVLTILVVCGTIGTLAFFRETYQLWTCILAFLLYPFSLGLFYFVQFSYSWN